MLTRSGTSPHDASLLLEMLSLPNDGRYPVLEMTPQQRRERTLDALATQLMSLTKGQAVLMILEDAHWSDHSTLEMLGRTVKIIATQPVLFVVTFRPEFEPAWSGQSHVTSLTINRLGRGEVDIMIDNVAGDQPVAASIRQDIMHRSDGVPLFVEEVTKAVLEVGKQADPPQIAKYLIFPFRSSCDIAGIACGSPRSFGHGKGSGANWGFDWTRVLVRPVGGCGSSL